MNVSKVGLNLQNSSSTLGECDRLVSIQGDNEAVLQNLDRTLKDFRGSIPVSAPQDFNVIRQQVLCSQRAYRRLIDES